MTKRAILLSLAAVLLAAVCFGMGWHLRRAKDAAEAPASGEASAERVYYPLHDFYALENSGGLHILNGFGTYQQKEAYTCGAAASLMVLRWFGDDSWDEERLAERMEADPDKGVSVEKLAGFFESQGWQTEVHMDTEPLFAIEDFEAFLAEKIDAGIPVIVDWVDWGGHWQVIIGYDDMGTEIEQDDVIIVADPYDTTDHNQDGYGIYPAERFLYNFTFYNFFSEESGELNDMCFLVATPENR